MRFFEVIVLIWLVMLALILAEQRLIQVFGVVPNMALLTGISLLRVFRERLVGTTTVVAAFLIYSGLFLSVATFYIGESILLLALVAFVSLFIESVTSHKIFDLTIVITVTTLLVALISHLLGLAVWQTGVVCLEVVLNSLLGLAVYALSVILIPRSYEFSGKRFIHV